MLVWCKNLIYILSILSSLAYAGRALEYSPEIYKSNDSTIDQKYSLNVLAIPFFENYFTIRFDVVSVSALLGLVET